MCSIDGCENEVKARGLCGMHYHRWERHGDPLKTVKRPNGTGSITSNGYIDITINGRRDLEHRFVMERILGRRLRKGELVHHKDEKRQHNQPDNLELMTAATHVPHHHLRRLVSATHAECTKCHIIKPLSDFSPDRSTHRKLKYQTRCKACKAEYAREHC